MNLDTDTPLITSAPEQTSTADTANFYFNNQTSGDAEQRRGLNFTVAAIS